MDTEEKDVLPVSESEPLSVKVTKDAVPGPNPDEETEGRL